MRAAGLRFGLRRKATLAVLGVLVAAWGAGCSPSHEEPQRPKEPPSIRSLGPSHSEPPPPQEQQQPKTKEAKPGETPQAPANPEPGAAGPGPKWTHQLVRAVEYYNDGPQQMRPPDGKLPAGAKVRVIRSAGSYALVESESGVRAYVAADALKELMP